MLQNNLSPSLEDFVCDVQLPVDSKEESHLVLVDLLDGEAGNLAPGTRRVVSVLKVLGGKDQGREEHAPTALKSAVRVAVLVLLGSEATLGNVRLDEDQIVQGDLQRRVTRTGAPKSLLDKGPQREHGSVARFRAAWSRRKRPDGFDDLSRGICRGKG
jgi:hypothetical protein